MSLDEVMEVASAPLETLEELRQVAKERWLSGQEVLTLLTDGVDKLGMSVEKELVRTPESGALVLFSKTETKNFRNDGYMWKTRRNGKQLDEAHMKLKARSCRRVPTPPAVACTTCRTPHRGPAHRHGWPSTGICSPRPRRPHAASLGCR